MVYADAIGDSILALPCADQIVVSLPDLERLMSLTYDMANKYVSLGAPTLKCRPAALRRPEWRPHRPFAWGEGVGAFWGGSSRRCPTDYGR